MGLVALITALGLHWYFWVPTPALDEVLAARERLRRPLVPPDLGPMFRECLVRQGMRDVQVITDDARVVVRRRSASNDVERGIEACWKQVEADFPDYFSADRVAPTTVVEFYAVYELLQTEVDCLKREGYRIDMPRFRAFLLKGGEWTPYDEIPPPQMPKLGMR